VVVLAAIAAAGCGSSSSSSSSSQTAAASATSSTAAAATGTGTSSSAGSGTSTSSSGAAPSGGGKTINIGNITSVAGLGGTFSGFQAGVKAFFDYYNAHGGINGYKINLTAIDDAGDPGKNAAAARTLVSSDHVVAVVGEASVADAASQKYLQAEHIPVIGGWAASSAWGPPATNMFVSLEGPNTPYCGVWSDDEAKEMGIKSMAFIAQAFPSAVQDAECRATAAKYEGIQSKTSKPIQASLTSVDYRPQVQQAMGTGAQALYFSAGADGVLKGIQAGQELGYKGLYIATQPAQLLSGLNSIGSALDNRVITSAFSLLPNDPNSYSPELAKYKAGIKQYEPKYATDVTSVSGWAAGKLFADALTAAGPSSSALEQWVSKQTHYTFGGLQGPVNYTLGSRPNPCVTQLIYDHGTFVRSPKAAPAPKFNCGPILNSSTGKPYSN
jgi:branched-chain amino acid transport system substrate-binding protein